MKITKLKTYVAIGFVIPLILIGYTNCSPSSSGSSEANQGANGQSPPITAKCGSTSSEPGLVVTTGGPVLGTLNQDSISFLGVPYAKPPIGSRRWKPPQPLDCNESTLRAQAFGPACLQKGPIGSEDCLTLNVWTPRTITTPRPVMVFIHGGGNMSGTPSEVNSGVELYNGQTIVERSDVIVVTLQYRLNIFGYLVDPSLASESAHGVSGNYGILDQIEALKWVKANISGFGGNPNQVTIFGESGGATDVCGLVATPLAAGLFSSAIIQSGGCGDSATQRVGSWSQTFVSNTSCAGSSDRLTCLRSLPASEIIAALPSEVTNAGFIVTPAGPTVDGYVFPRSPIEMFSRGEHNRVPVIIGVNADETALPLFGVPNALTSAQYSALLRSVYGTDLGNKVLARYPAANYPSPRKAFIAVTTDSQFVCPSRQAARALIQGQSEPVFRYLYSHTMQGTGGLLGAAHGLELFYVFQTMNRLPSYTPSAGDFSLEESVLKYWTQFARFGNPNGLGNVFWPRNSSAIDEYLNLDATPISEAGMRSALCDFWDQ